MRTETGLSVSLQFHWYIHLNITIEIEEMKQSVCLFDMQSVCFLLTLVGPWPRSSFCLATEMTLT